MLWRRNRLCFVSIILYLGACASVVVNLVDLSSFHVKTKQATFVYVIVGIFGLIVFMLYRQTKQNRVAPVSMESIEFVVSVFCLFKVALFRLWLIHFNVLFLYYKHSERILFRPLWNSLVGLVR